MSGETILVVDDSNATLDFAVDYVLKPNGYRPVTAHDGAEGVRKVLAAPPDLIILDLEMPKMNGLDVLRALNGRSLNIPVILSTAHGSEGIAIEVFRLGVRDYVTKPYEVKEMLASIEYTLNETRIKRERDEILKRLMQTNRSLEARIRELNTLYGIGKSMTALLDHDDLLKRIVEAAQYVTGAQSSALELRDIGTGKLISETSIGAREDGHQTGSAQALHRVIRTRRPALDPTEVAVPLLVGGKIIGTLDVVNTATTRHFNDHDVHMLQALADYAAIAIENSRLFRELEESKEREKKVIRNLFERYVAPSVVDRLLSSPRMAALGGARQPITALFADVRGFTSLAEQLQPETLIQTLNDYLSLGAQAILNREGTLDKFMGDAIMAFFNAPILQQDYPLRAVLAAIDMQQTIAAHAAKRQTRVPLTFGVGIGSGDAIVGNIGTSQLMNFTAIGPSVNLAKRLQEMAQGGQIMIDEATYRAVADRVRVKPLGRINLKGFRSPPQIYEVIGLH